MRIVFASDTHLCAERPRQNAEFAALLDLVRDWRAELYLLGDVVEFWPGDDDDAPLHRDLVARLAALSAAGCRVRVARGNRDFSDFVGMFAGRILEWTPDTPRVPAPLTDVFPRDEFYLNNGVPGIDTLDWSRAR